MSGFLALESYSPVLTLIVGLGGFFGLWGGGLLAWRSARLPTPWNHVIAAVSGILLFSLGCQLMAFASIASRRVLGVYLAAWMIVGFGYWLSQLTNLRRLWKILHPWMFLFLIPAAVLLIMAMSGSTKIDELYYHMLMPARIVEYQGLKFFGYPWQSAVPQMGYQTAFAPFHAIGFPHAGNIISSLLALTFSCFTFALVRERHSSAFGASLVAALLLVGMYPVVWYVTGGAHSFGDLSVAAAIVGNVCYPVAPAGVTPRAWRAAISTLLVAGAVSKISLLPLAALVWCWPIVQAWHRNGRILYADSLAAAMAPWLLFYLPMVLWTWFRSGSPFGPILAGWFGPTVYATDEVHRAIESQSSRIFPGIGPFIGYGHCLLLWVLVATMWFVRDAPRLLPALALGLQGILIALLLPLDTRFLGGTQYAAAVLVAMHLPRRWVQWITCGFWRKAGLVICLLPWFAVQLYYAAPFAASVVGMMSRDDFHRRYIAFYDDFQQLNSLLPPDAEILTAGVRPDSIYFPRKIYVNRMDVTGGHPVYLFACRLTTDQLAQRIPEQYTLGPLIYRNPNALKSVSRVPGVASKRGLLRVFRLIGREPTPGQH
ncbi:MAG: hypothetical protein RIK87_28310 [Fuerstiella sp.]